MVTARNVTVVTEYLAFYTRYRINRCRYNRLRLYSTHSVSFHTSTVVVGVSYVK